LAQFKFSDDAIAHVLSDRVLSVPIYQRSFAWTEDEVRDYWGDLIDTFRGQEQEYFIGNLVFSDEDAVDGTLAIIDGQQRLATTLMLLAAIREEYAERGESEAAEEIYRTFISTFDPREREQRPRLKLNSDDNECFRTLIVNRVPLDEITPQRHSHELILSAYRLLRESVRKFAWSSGERWYEALLSLREFLERRLRVVVVDVPTEADAFLIFETLNDRGADLTIADLLKNYLFRRAGPDLDTVRDAWMFALGNLEVGAENRTFITFLRHYWSSKHGATRERDLFGSIKERVTTRAHAVDLAAEIRVAANQYAAVLNSDHELWASFGDSARANIESLNRLSLEQVRPLLLALIQHFQTGELQYALRALVSWGVRGLVVGGIGGGTAERAYCQAAMEVRAGNIKTTQDLAEQLDSFIPGDEEFGNAFASRRVTNGRLARYYLYALERAEMGKDEPELVPNQDAEEVNLEHIFPKNATGSDWAAFEMEERATWVYRLGNMVLLKKGPNDKIGNKPWSEKRPVLAASELRLTQRAARYEEWDKTAIDETQQHMASLALQAWPRRS